MCEIYFSPQLKAKTPNKSANKIECTNPCYKVHYILNLCLKREKNILFSLSFIHPNVLPNLYDFYFLLNIERDILKNVGNHWQKY